jgi:hypothetical protein
MPKTVLRTDFSFALTDEFVVTTDFVRYLKNSRLLSQRTKSIVTTDLSAKVKKILFFGVYTG